MIVVQTDKYKIDQAGNRFKAYVNSGGNWAFLGRYESEGAAKAKINEWLDDSKKSPIVKGM